MKKTEKIYTKEEVASQLTKSMYKAVKKAINSRKDDTKKIVEDILDPDNVSEVDPDEVPTNAKIKVVHKSEESKSLKSDKHCKKGVDKLKFFLEKKNNINSNL